MSRFEESKAPKSKYIKFSREATGEKILAYLYMISLFFVPSYTGIQTPFFDFTVLRIMILVMLIFIIDDKKRTKIFFGLFKTKWIGVTLPYLFVCFYTMIARTDINSFLNIFFEIIQYALALYVIK